MGDVSLNRASVDVVANTRRVAAVIRSNPSCCRVLPSVASVPRWARPDCLTTMPGNPYPGAVDGRCLDPIKQPFYLGDTTLLTRLRDWRYHPEWSFPLPGDIDYVSSIPNAVAVSFCLKEADYLGPKALKLLAVEKLRLPGPHRHHPGRHGRIG